MKKLITILTLILIASCGNDEDNSDLMSETDIELVTGINLRDSNGYALMQLGNPNILNDQIIISPNPPTGIVSIKTSDKLTDIWIVPAKAEKIYKSTNFNIILNSELYSESEIESYSDLEFKNLDANNMTLDLRSLKSGYYKVFVKINGNIFWDNLFISKDNFDIANLIDYWKS